MVASVLLRPYWVILYLMQVAAAAAQSLITCSAQVLLEVGMAGMRAVQMVHPAQ
jgi:hypothetical protein